MADLQQPSVARNLPLQRDHLDVPRSCGAPYAIPVPRMERHHDDALSQYREAASGGQRRHAALDTGPASASKAQPEARSSSLNPRPHVGVQLEDRSEVAAVEKEEKEEDQRAQARRRRRRLGGRARQEERRME
eukprot:3047473-Rhodomonas_salina.1